MTGHIPTVPLNFERLCLFVPHVVGERTVIVHLYVIPIGQKFSAECPAGKTIHQVNEITTTIASAVEEQSAANQEIARNVEQASVGTGEVTSNITGVTQAAGETGQAAVQIQEAAGELSKQSTTLKVEVDKFLDEIRAG